MSGEASHRASPSVPQCNTFSTAGSPLSSVRHRPAVDDTTALWANGTRSLTPPSSVIEQLCYLGRSVVYIKRLGRGDGHRALRLTLL